MESDSQGKHTSKKKRLFFIIFPNGYLKLSVSNMPTKLLARTAAEIQMTLMCSHSDRFKNVNEYLQIF